MSDLPPKDSFLKWKLGIEGPSFAYANKISARQVVMVVAIPYPLLKAWHKYMAEVQDHKKHQRKTASNLDCNFSSCSSHDSCGACKITCVDLFEFSVPGNMFAINDDETVKAEVNKSLSRLAGLVTLQKQLDLKS